MILGIIERLVWSMARKRRIRTKRNGSREAEGGAVAGAMDVRTGGENRLEWRTKLEHRMRLRGGMGGGVKMRVEKVTEVLGMRTESKRQRVRDRRGE